MTGAPYRFARINRWVHFPDWAALVSHDVPFKDGFCGTIRFDIVAMTPLLVGGPRTKATQQAPGNVWPVRLPDGRYAIPPSSLQGMVRSILTVASFGRLGGRVEDRRFAVRDLSGTKTSEHLFQDRLTSGNGRQGNPIVPGARAGWLVRRGGKHVVIPCCHARIHIADLCGLPAVAPAVAHVLQGGTKADRRLQEVASVLPGLALQVTVQPVADHRHTPGLIRYARCTPAAGAGGKPGTVVLTGKPTAGLHAGKKREFVFHTPDRASAPSHQGKEVPADVWRDFIDIHQPPKGSGRKVNPNWDYWRKDFEAGSPVPVFYLEEGGQITAMGTASMFKAAMPLSTHDLLRNSSPDHFSTAPDLPTLIFGAAEGETDAEGLKRRASFGFGTTAANPKLETKQVALSSPKPAFYPNYVRQHPHDGETIPEHLPYAAYASFQGYGSARERPELAGTKIYPSRGQIETQALPKDKQGRILNNVVSRLHTLPAGTPFPNIPLRIHNLRAIEVGALLWALCFGKAEHLAGMTSPLRHRLGMGKPLGLGEIRIGNVRIELESNDGRQVPDAAAFIHAFVEHMKAHYPGGEWQGSVQVQALLKAADPRVDHGELSYHGDYDGYSKARAAGRFLPDYLAGHEIARPGGETQPPPPAPGDAGRHGGGGHGGHRPGAPGGHRAGGPGGQRGGPRRDRPPPPRQAAPQFREGQRVRADGRVWTVVGFEDGQYDLEDAAGVIISRPAGAITRV